MKFLNYLWLSFLSCFCFSAMAQNAPRFTNGDRVVFVGNSITHGGRYHQYIWLYYMTRFPEMRITIMNAGIGGEVAEQMFKRLETDVYAKKPSVIALTFGMNDTGYFEFLQANSSEKSKEKLDRSYKAYLRIDSSFKKHTGSKKIIIAGSPYDETSKFGKDNFFPGKSKALLETANFQEAVAKKSGWSFVDFNRPMTAINLREQAKDSTYTIIGNDRIHPGVDGHLVMAYLFLKAQGLKNKKVAEMTINATTSKVERTDNCIITDVKAGQDELRFDYLAKALPYPVDTMPTGEWNAMQRRETDALELVPFNQELNQEMLFVKGLKNNNYAVEIDGRKIGEWSAEQLGAGINLAEQRRTPQYEQAMAIKKLNEERWQIERRLRDYAWMEYDFLMDKGLLFKDDLATLDTIYTHINEGFVRGNLDNYLKARYPEVRQGWQRQMDVLVEEIYRINKPQKHSFYIHAL
ncbi:SGNH/GDSL hydrolase family protein [Niabella ginsengisoli]|uniref:SGNH/GDSL hydrolase family protein n=1 Tax=Niabella ginsengisoli TaxID=522298 RepID=A0ABS9SDM9_9BACT|nr:SGNH/GDSL hydrolase family protein [Niabella ginsengisoli]MCH5596468.1 SGNH/GDSL hydrolase family protein [Niabella ginsengisoli]